MLNPFRWFEYAQLSSLDLEAHCCGICEFTELG